VNFPKLLRIKKAPGIGALNKIIVIDLL